MDNVYYIGDLVFSKMPSSVVNLLYLFNGAKKTDNGWTVYMSAIVAQGYAGGGSTIEFNLKVGDTIRVGENCKGRMWNPVRPNKATDKKISAIHFDNIEKDMIELSFDLK